MIGRVDSKCPCEPDQRFKEALTHRALMKMDTDLIHAPAVGLTEEEEADMNDWKLPLAFMKKRHSEKIEGSKALAQSWRMKDRVNIWLVLFLPLALSVLQRVHLELKHSCLCFQPA